MTAPTALPEQFAAYVGAWAECPERQTFLTLFDLLRSLGGVQLDFVLRPGIGASLRAARECPGSRCADRPLFVLADVVEVGEERWLSVCFYGDMVSDPDDLGELIPGGLLGADGYCFDLDATDATSGEYVRARIVEAHAACAERE